MDKRSQKTYPVFVRNPFNVLVGWKKSHIKQALISVALSPFYLLWADFISSPSTPKELIIFIFLTLIISPCVWFVLMMVLNFVKLFLGWLEQD